MFIAEPTLYLVPYDGYENHLCKLMEIRESLNII